KQVFYLRVPFLAERSLHRRQYLLVRAVLKIARRGQAFRHAGREQPEGGERPFQIAAHAVVDRDFLQFAGGSDWLSGDRIEQRAAFLDDDLLLASDRQPAVQQGAQDRDEVGITLGERFVDRFELCRSIAAGQLLDDRGVSGGRGGGSERRQRESEQAHEAHFERSLADRENRRHAFPMTARHFCISLL